VKFLADEGVDRQIVAALRQDGHELLYIAELDPESTTPSSWSRQTVSVHSLLLRIKTSASWSIDSAVPRGELYCFGWRASVISPGYLRIRRGPLT
jgi:Domain of unknown function (DUF5615)